jgi:hypothetical protein
MGKVPFYDITVFLFNVDKCKYLIAYVGQSAPLRFNFGDFDG